jgi:signal transduction histidine kinase
LIEGTAKGCYCSVVLIDSNGTHLEHGAAPSLPPSFIRSIIGRPVNLDSGPCAMASYLNQQVIAADLTSETRWASHAWCPMALAHGLYSCWSTPICSTAGKVLGAFAIYYDQPKAPTSLHQFLIEQFTHIASIAIERAQRETTLKRSEAFLAEAQRLSSTGSFSWQVARNEITWSEELYRIFELAPCLPLTLESIATRVHPDDLPLFQQMLAASRDGKDFEYDHRLSMPDGSVKHVHVVAHCNRDSKGQLEYIGAIQDVTRQRHSDEALCKLRSELAHATRVMSLGTLTASIAHELNQPLAVVVASANTCSRLLDVDPIDVARIREITERTISDANRASAIVERLRALFSNKPTAMHCVDLNEATREVLVLARSEIFKCRAILQADLADDLPPVTGDRVQLQQVILNLLLNALDAMKGVDDRERRLVVRTRRDHSHVQLCVEDTGTGFDAQGGKRLFDAFYTTKPNGMGVGLCVSRSIVESHQGQIWAVSNVGTGATFSFSIPQRSQEQRAAS